MTIRERWRRLRLLVARGRAERELEEEMRLHVALREERLRGDGLAPDAARDAARRRFGNHARLREDSVEAWGWRRLEQLPAGHAIRGALPGVHAAGRTQMLPLQNWGWVLAIAGGPDAATLSVTRAIVLVIALAACAIPAARAGSINPADALKSGT